MATNASAILQRYQVDLPDAPAMPDLGAMSMDFAAEDRQLAQQARDLLGYDVLQKHVNRRSSGILGAQASATMGRNLAEVLRMLDIEPFLVETVESYKNECLLSKSWNGKPQLRILDRITWWGLAYGSAITIASLITAVIFAQAFAGAPISNLAWMVTACSAILTLAALVIGLTAFGDLPILYEWRVVPIHRYTSPIPQFALERATQIASRFPKVRFSVEEMIEKTEEDPKTADPFLVAEYGDERYYLEVWSEPQFERQNL